MDALELLLNPERAAGVPGPHIPPEADTWALCGITSLLQRFHANTLPLRQHETGPYRLPPQMTCATMVLATIDLHWIADICRRADRSATLVKSRHRGVPRRATRRSGIAQHDQRSSGRLVGHQEPVGLERFSGGSPCWKDVLPSRATNTRILEDLHEQMQVLQLNFVRFLLQQPE